MNLNRAELIGNLTANPVVKTLPSGSKIANFSLAIRLNWKDGKTKELKENMEYLAVVAFGQLANVVAKYLKKGDRVYIDGRMKTTQWQGKDKSRRSKTEIVASNMIMLGQKNSSKADKTNDSVVVDEISDEKE
jgi:single-strand DNA-binding protein